MPPGLAAPAGLVDHAAGTGPRSIGGAYFGSGPVWYAAGYSAAKLCLTAQAYQLSTTVPVSRMPMPPVRGHNTANHHAQRWIDSNVALKPIVQRQNSAPRSAA